MGPYMARLTPHQHGIAYTDINDQYFRQAMNSVPFLIRSTLPMTLYGPTLIAYTSTIQEVLF